MRATGPGRLGGLKPSDGARAAEAFAGARLVLFPTETFYALGCDPRGRRAVARLLAAKGRPPGKPLPLIAAGLAEALMAACLPPPLARLAVGLWPAPLTLVAQARQPSLWAAGVLAADGTMAVRVSSHPVARWAAAAAGGLVVATSANHAGQPPAAQLSGSVVHQLVGDDGLEVAGGRLAGGLPSTVLAWSDGAPRLLRPGAVSWDTIVRALG